MSVVLSFNGSVMGSSNGSMLGGTWIDPYNPLGLPPRTIRLLFTTGVTPTFQSGTAVQVSSDPNVWDLTTQGTGWADLLMQQYNLLEVLGANATGITNMHAMFYDCTSLRSVALFDTSAVTSAYAMFCRCTSLLNMPLYDLSSLTSMVEMFEACHSLAALPLFDTSSVTNMTDAFSNCRTITEIPLFDTSSVTNFSSAFDGCESLNEIPLLDTSSAGNVDYMFNYCRSVQRGAQALYQQMSAQTIPPSTHIGCFNLCGDQTVSGRAELAQIPQDWGGTAT